jgi:hypothetical protein
MAGPAAHPAGFLSASLRLGAMMGSFFFVFSFVSFVNFVVERQ